MSKAVIRNNASGISGRVLRNQCVGGGERWDTSAERLGRQKAQRTRENFVRAITSGEDGRAATCLLKRHEREEGAITSTRRTALLR